MRRLNPEKLYRHGFTSPEQLELAPNLILAVPIRRPEKMGGLVTVGDDPRFESMAFRVVACGPFEERLEEGRVLPANPLGVAVGDVVACRNAFFEPVQADRKLHVGDVRHVWAVVQRRADANAQAAEEADIAETAAAAEEAAAAELATTRQGLVKF